MGTPTTEPGGVLLVDKPAGITSHDVVSIVRRASYARRVGHAGTLDPFATGLLVVLVGRGTRLIPFIDGEPKVYDATIRFGAETDTDDATGETTRTAAAPSAAAIAEALPRLTGEISQVPPSYSAKQIEGTRAYAAARRGSPLELPAVNVSVHSWQILARSGDDLTVRITCGGGTYIRALARDLGRLTASAAHLTALRRVRAGVFSVDDAASVDAIRAGQFSLRPLRSAIPSLPVQRLGDDELRRVVHGNPVPNRAGASRVALVDDREELIAVADAAGPSLQPKLVLRDV
jgi:tRNA pseudouridine55 synthase